MANWILNAPMKIMLYFECWYSARMRYHKWQFHQAIGLTALLWLNFWWYGKGGIIFAIAEIGLPPANIGVGEQMMI